MAERAIQMILAARDEKAHLNRVVVRVGAAAAWVAAAIFLLAGVLTGDGMLFVKAVGPIIAAGLMTIQILARREDGGIALFGSGLVVASWYTIFGDNTTAVPAAVSLVVIAALGMLFVERGTMSVVPGVMVGLGAMPLLWPLDPTEQLFLGVVMALSFVMAFFIFRTLQANTSSLKDRYQLLFEASPTALLEEDWSEAIQYLRAEYTGKPERIKQFLHAYPAVVERAVGLAKVISVNDAAVELLEITNPARFLGYRDPRLVDEASFDGIVEGLVGLYEGARSWETEVPYQSRDGETLWLQARSVNTSNGIPASSILVALADVTHLKSRQQAMAELVRAKNEFIANVSHELRTPLTAVIGLTAELAAGNGVSGANEQSELLGVVADQAAEMSNIVDDLLVAARSEIGTVAVDLEPVDLRSELEATLAGLGVEVDLRLRDTQMVRADPRRVRQILRNLLTNAHRYGGPDKRVVTGSVNGRVYLEVRDNGDGIPDDDAERIFDPYVTGHTGFHGSVGLGLAVARQLAELMGGSLTYQRSAAESVFRLELPVSDDSGRVLASQSNTR